MDAFRVAVIVVTYNSADVIAGCLESLAVCSGTRLELTDVVVVDNASDDRTIEIAMATNQLPISVIRSGANVGYAAGLNAGLTSLRRRVPDAVMVVNPDCRLMPGALATLAEALIQPGRGIVAPRLLNPDGTLQPSLRRRPTVAGMFAESILGGRVADRVGLGELIFAATPHSRPGFADWVTGAALLMSWEVVEGVGPWDERFLLYSEETEFLLRAADHGWATWYEPSAVVEHKGGESGTRPDLAALLTVNRVRLFRRRHGARRALAYGAALVIGMTIRAAAGQQTARASLAALLFKSRRITSLAELG